MGTLFDSVNPHAIPHDAKIVGGYADGHYKWSNEAWAMFPLAHRITIITSPHSDITMVGKPCIYCTLSDLPAVEKAMHGLDWDLWLANPTNVPHLHPGSVATQYAWPPHTGGAYDLSQTADSWPHEAWTFCIDVEKGDFTPQQAADYVRAHAQQYVPAPPNNQGAPNMNEGFQPSTDPGDTDSGLAADGNTKLDAPIVAAINVPNSPGAVWLVSADGGVFTLGGAQYHGSVPELKDKDGNDIKLHTPICAIVADSHTGYILIGEDGGTFPFGSAVPIGVV